MEDGTAAHIPAPGTELIAGRHRFATEVFEIMAAHLGPFIDQSMRSYFAVESSWLEAAANRMGRPTEHGATDPLFQLLVLRRFWGPVFLPHYGKDLRPLVGRLVDARNKWAHFSLPDDVDELDQLVLAAERLVAPIEPDGAVAIRSLRTRLRDYANNNKDDALLDSAQNAKPSESQTRKSDLLAEQLVETERVFSDLQAKYSAISSELEVSQASAIRKQLRLQSIEQDLTEISGRSDALEINLALERRSRDRLEWLFVGFITVLMVVIVLLQ